MPDIVVAADESAASELLRDAQATLGTLTRSGSGTLGPFNTNWSVSASLGGGSIDLRTPDIVRIVDCELRFSLNFSLSFDLSSIIPNFCLPRICVPIPFVGLVCTPQICVDWPTVTIPVGISDVVKFTADFRLDPRLVGPNWEIDVVIAGIPSLQLGLVSTAILTAIGLAAAAILAPIPFIGPVLALAVAGITAAIGVAAITGFLGPILTPFVSGLRLTIYRQPQVFELLPASLPLDPAVTINLDQIAARVASSDEDELLIEADIS